MLRFSFVLKETTPGRNDHIHHMGRRNVARGVAIAAGCTVPGDPQEMLVAKTGGGNDWYYWWVLDAPDLATVLQVIKVFTVDNNSVELAVAPVLHN
jgi:hypothetical protein